MKKLFLATILFLLCIQNCTYSQNIASLATLKSSSTCSSIDNLLINGFFVDGDKFNYCSYRLEQLDVEFSSSYQISKVVIYYKALDHEQNVTILEHGGPKVYKLLDGSTSTTLDFGAIGTIPSFIIDFSQAYTIEVSEIEIIDANFIPTWTSNKLNAQEIYHNGNVTIGKGQVDSYLKIKTNSRSWWTGVGATSGDNKFVIYDSTANSRRLTIGLDGNVGVGYDVANYKLDVNGVGHFGTSALIGTNIAAGYYQDVSNGAYRSLNVAGNTGYYFQTYNGASTKMYVGLQGSYAGKVGIGTITPGYELDVIGTIRAKEMRVDNKGADFVFDNSYKLLSLADLENFVKQNKHLPEIASASQMQKEGVSVGDMQTKLLQKIEELTLYVIEKDKEFVEQKKKNADLERQIAELRALINKK